MKAIVWDIEVERGPRPKLTRDEVSGIEYARDWDDVGNMGVSCIGFYDYSDDSYQVSLTDNLGEFIDRVERTELLIGFNSIKFDCAVMKASLGIELGHFQHYDVLRELWVGLGLPPTGYNEDKHSTGLDDCARVNLGLQKTGNGALAPIHWQQGRRGQVINYCLNDVRLTKKLFERIEKDGGLVDPRGPSGKFIPMSHGVLNA